jgi:hypothetical protein
MSILLVATVSSQPVARRLACCLGAPRGNVERRTFPDGEHYVFADVIGRHVT